MKKTNRSLVKFSTPAQIEPVQEVTEVEPSTPKEVVRQDDSDLAYGSSANCEHSIDNNGSSHIRIPIAYVEEIREQLEELIHTIDTLILFS